MPTNPETPSLVASSRLLLIDSDLFVLLSGAGLLEALLSALDVEEGAARRLQPLPHMLEKGRLARRYPPGIREKAQAWCPRIPPLEAVPDPATLEQLLLVPGIDPGEALLFGVAAETGHTLLASGDRRSFEAIAASSDLSGLRAQLEGKLLALESALDLLRRNLPYQDLTRKLASVRDYHRTVRVLLSQGEQTPEASFRGGLDSYLRDLRSQLEGLLF